MSDDLSDVLNNFKAMMDSGNVNIPDNLKEMLGSLNTNSTNTTSNANTSHQNINTGQIRHTKQITSPQSNSLDNSGLNIDIETILKMKNIIDSINRKDDPRANLLYSLKPYLRDSRKKQLDQYVNLLNVTKIADIMKNDKRENKGNAK